MIPSFEYYRLAVLMWQRRGRIVFIARFHLWMDSALDRIDLADTYVYIRAHVSCHNSNKSCRYEFYVHT